jgi:hypothetical protein
MSFSDRIKAAFNGNTNAASSNLSEQAFQWAVDQRSRGNQIELFCGPPPGINLQAGEAVYGCLPGTTLMEPHSVRTHRAGSNGVSIRVAKGLSFRLGGIAGRSESHEELRSLDVGPLILTSERLIFIGSLRTKNISLADLLGLEAFTDALRVSQVGKSKPEIYALDLGLRLRSGSGQGLPIRHDMLRAAIEQAADIVNAQHRG